MDDNIHNLRDALEWLDRRIREEAEYDGEMSNEHAIELAFIQNMLAKFPLRQCDVGTPEEQAHRFHDFCVGNSSDIKRMCKPSCPCIDCFDRCQCMCKWAQLPYEAEEGAGR